jgi:hypothetical protein
VTENLRLDPLAASVEVAAPDTGSAETHATPLSFEHYLGAGSLVEVSSSHFTATIATSTVHAPGTAPRSEGTRLS